MGVSLLKSSRLLAAFPSKVLLVELLPPRLQLRLRKHRPHLLRPLLQLPRDLVPRDPRQPPALLHDLAVDEDGVDVRAAREEDERLERVVRAREGRRARVPDDEVGLLADLHRADEVREVQRLGAAERRQAEGVLRGVLVVQGRRGFAFLFALVCASCAKRGSVDIKLPVLLRVPRLCCRMVRIGVNRPGPVTAVASWYAALLSRHPRFVCAILTAPKPHLTPRSRAWNATGLPIPIPSSLNGDDTTAAPLSLIIAHVASSGSVWAPKTVQWDSTTSGPRSPRSWYAGIRVAMKAIMSDVGE